MDKVREAIAAGRPAFACWVSGGDPLMAEILARSGYDCLILDCQHGGVHLGELVGLMQALDLGGARAVVRVNALDQGQIMRALDLGALGVIVPMVSTEAQARAAAEAIHYPPKGIRSFGMVRNYYGLQPDAADPLCLVMIETAEALDNLDAIAATPGVSGLFLGPMDMALSLGLKPSMEMPSQVLDAVDAIVAACRRHGKIAGAACLGVANAHELIGRGMQYIAQGADLGFLRRGAAGELEQLRAFRPAAASA